MELRELALDHKYINHIIVSHFIKAFSLRVTEQNQALLIAHFENGPQG